MAVSRAQATGNGEGAATAAATLHMAREAGSWFNFDNSLAETDTQHGLC